MHVFVTGATGWIGTAVVDELLAAGHEVTGLARSDASATTLEATGVRVRRGDLDDPTGIAAGADAAEATIHLANLHDFSDMARSNAAERGAVQAVAGVYRGSGRPFLIASGLATVARGRPATEEDPSPARGPDSARGGAENYVLDLVPDGLRAVALRFAPSVHGMGDHGFVAELTRVARERGVSGYPADGTNRWAAVHRSDAARLAVLGLGAPAGSRLHAVGEEGIPSREIAEAIGRSEGLPVVAVDPGDVADHFGWIGMFFGLDLTGGSAATRELLGWTPTGPTLLEDIGAGAYR
ncbi:SDR family oxidoreductase [Phycicoccus sp. CSK15P-2]|uniref:SDR family oxidoreductase n=1 Tax=Phycicoccus sp. CSK15P-2 TaxID=2807627 RepID=UPI0019506FDF|nr:SDR family oxidoreductase [Phycicoccus sp. CSK15P-2]MBM6402632.1 SDR family oxidoreductase [Phycicoccus sp. CSK15P-2]